MSFVERVGSTQRPAKMRREGGGHREGGALGRRSQSQGRGWRGPREGRQPGWQPSTGERLRDRWTQGKGPGQAGLGGHCEGLNFCSEMRICWKV